MPRTTIWSFVVTATLLVMVGCNYLIEGAGAQSASNGYLTGGCDTPQTPFCDALMAPIPTWTGHIFQLSQNYPTAVGPEAQPWVQFDPKTQPDQYLNAVLSYFFEGNIQTDVESSFDPALNTVRTWYNAPWQDVGINGREFIHGLTRERVSRPHELAPEQVHEWNNYAVGFYNPPGGMDHRPRLAGSWQSRSNSCLVSKWDGGRQAHIYSGIGGGGALFERFTPMAGICVRKSKRSRSKSHEPTFGLKSSFAAN